MKLVREHIEFTRRDIDYGSLDIGKNREETWPRKYDDLDQEMKIKVKKIIRKNKEENFLNEIEIIIDDDYLLEPLYDDIIKTLGFDPYLTTIKGPIIGNIFKKIYFSLNFPKFINIQEAMNINYSSLFLKWLGINEELYLKLDYNIIKDSINFENFNEEKKFTLEEDKILKKAQIKFEKHCQWILDNIEVGYKYQLSNKNIEDEIEFNKWNFDRKGNII